MKKIYIMMLVIIFLITSFNVTYADDEYTALILSPRDGFVDTDVELCVFHFYYKVPADSVNEVNINVEGIIEGELISNDVWRSSGGVVEGSFSISSRWNFGQNDITLNVNGYTDSITVFRVDSENPPANPPPELEDATYSIGDIDTLFNIIDNSTVSEIKDYIFYDPNTTVNYKNEQGNIIKNDYLRMFIVANNYYLGNDVTFMANDHVYYSKYGDEYISYENSYLYNYLTNDFYNSFSTSLKNSILDVPIHCSTNKETNFTRDLTEKIYIPDINEMRHYAFLKSNINETFQYFKNYYSIGESRNFWTRSYYEEYQDYMTFSFGGYNETGTYSYNPPALIYGIIPVFNLSEETMARYVGNNEWHLLLGDGDIYSKPNIDSNFDIPVNEREIVKIISPNDGFKDNQINQCVLHGYYKIFANSVDEVSINWEGIEYGELLSNNVIQDGINGIVEGYVSIATNWTYGSHVITFNVNNYSDSITIERLQGFVDENGDGIDDRTGQTEVINTGIDYDTNNLGSSVFNAIKDTFTGFAVVFNFIGNVLRFLPDEIIAISTSFIGLLVLLRILGR